METERTSGGSGDEILDHSCLSPESSLLDALRSLERSGSQIVLVVKQGELVGTLTDGDVRRALLSGATLTDRIVRFHNVSFVSVSPATPRADVLDMMQARRIAQVPVVDEEARLLGLHLLHELLGATARPNIAVVMAGGKGTRLYPITQAIPKPMIKVAGRPILERIVLHLVSHGIRTVYLSINYMADVVERHFSDGARFGCDVRYLREAAPLGTAGSLRLLPEIPEYPVLVMNGDLVTQVDLGAMLTAHERTAASITVGVRPYVHEVPFGCLELNGTRVLRIEEKPRLMKTASAGVYALEPRLLSLIPPSEEFSMPALLECAIAQGDAVHAFEIEDDWIDVGQREQLQQARGEHQ